MAIRRTDALNDMFESHPSLTASLEEFENNDNPSPVFRLPSQHSGFKSDDSEADATSNSEPPWSPQHWRRPDTGSGWYRHQPYRQESPVVRLSASPTRSRETSPKYESADENKEDYTIPANVPLPRGSVSPAKERPPSPPPFVEGGQHFRPTFVAEEINEETIPPASHNNYIRFAVRAEVQQRTEPLEAMFSWFQSFVDQMSRNKMSWAAYSTTALLSIFILSLLSQTPTQTALPDLVRVASLARSMEPVIFYSENGVRQINDLERTSVAVWDLGESMRNVNMTSSEVIVTELDALTDNLKRLAMELTRFFANVDGDVEAILIVMNWAKSELAMLPTQDKASAFSKMHHLFSRLGLLENRSTGEPTAIGNLVKDLFGLTAAQHTRFTVQRTFVEFLATLEEAIDSELIFAANLIGLFSDVDRQFLTLQRITVRESNNQERLEGEFLSSLWTRVLGPNATKLRKYEKNKGLLKSIRSKTVANRDLLVEHNSRLLALKENLEMLRRQLVSPLVKGGRGSTVGVEEQILGLDGIYGYLRGVRQEQKRRVYEARFGVGSGTGRTTITREGAREIDGR